MYCKCGGLSTNALYFHPIYVCLLCMSPELQHLRGHLKSVVLSTDILLHIAHISWPYASGILFENVGFLNARSFFSGAKLMFVFDRNDKDIWKGRMETFSRTGEFLTVYVVSFWKIKFIPNLILKAYEMVHQISVEIVECTNEIFLAHKYTCK